MILLLTPPFTQLNTPYPATSYIKGFLNTKGISSYQMDLGLEVILNLFSPDGLKRIFEQVGQKKKLGAASRKIVTQQEEYLRVIAPTIQFLQGKNDELAKQINSFCYLPLGKRFKQFNANDWSFEQLSESDKAKHLATLFLEDLGDFIQTEIDPHFSFSRYGERLGRSANSFDELKAALSKKPSLIEEIFLEILDQQLKKISPQLVCFTVPFPGNLFAAFRCAQHIKKHFPPIKTAMGGGFPNTELRDLTEAEVFKYFDFITLDDGELPLELLIQHLQNSKCYFKRTFLLENGQVKYINNALQKDYHLADTGTPDFSDLLLEDYISVLEIANPMHSLWSNERWNKLTMAHGCYWGKCTFCDISLDYIARYEPIEVKLLVNRMEELLLQTGIKGFHFVDEAAPPKLMKALAQEIIARNLNVHWWTNIRFEKSFTPELALLLAQSGCIAVSGGLEVASDRLLQLIDKGISVQQVAKVCKNFTQSGILVHAYLMYGYPSQSIQETVDSLEYVRQLFEAGVIQSGFWHQFALTAHSPIFKDPEKYGIVIHPKKITFANNDVAFTDTTGIDHELFSFGLKKSMYNFLHDNGFDLPLQTWFDFKIPKTTVPKNVIEKCL